MEHNVLGDHNDGSSKEGCVQNVENEDYSQNVNWKMVSPKIVYDLIHMRDS